MATFGDTNEALAGPLAASELSFGSVEIALDMIPITLYTNANDSS
jgi:hypothetical protein